MAKGCSDRAAANQGKHVGFVNYVPKATFKYAQIPPSAGSSALFDYGLLAMRPLATLRRTNPAQYEHWRTDFLSFGLTSRNPSFQGPSVQGLLGPRKAEPDVDAAAARVKAIAEIGPQVTGVKIVEGTATHHPVGVRSFKRTAISRRTFV